MSVSNRYTDEAFNIKEYNMYNLKPLKYCNCCKSTHYNYDKLTFNGVHYKDRKKKKALGLYYDCGCGSTLLVLTKYGKGLLK